MADIQQYLDDIMDARYGEEVRGSIHDAIEKINNVSDEAVNNATEALEKAEGFVGAAEDAREAAGEARAAAGSANTAADKANEAASTIDENIDQGIDERLEDTLAAAKEARDAATRANKASESIGDVYGKSFICKNFIKTDFNTIGTVTANKGVQSDFYFDGSKYKDEVDYFVILGSKVDWNIDEGIPISPIIVNITDITLYWVDGNFPGGNGFPCTSKSERVFSYAVKNLNNATFTDVKVAFYLMGVKEVDINPSGVSLADLIADAQEKLLQIDSSIQKVDTAISNINEAISNAETAIQNANTAAENANQSIEKANQAVSTANSALEEAGTATENANTALSQAQQAISSADEAKQEASEAASVANSAALRASQASTQANSAAETALAAADEASKIVDQATSKEYVNEQIKGIEIGGYQILKGTNNKESYILTTESTQEMKTNWQNSKLFCDWIGKNNSPEKCEIIDVTDCPNPDVNVGVRFKAQYSEYWWSCQQMGVPFKYNQKYTLSCYFRSSQPTSYCTVGGVLFQSNGSTRIEQHFDHITLTKENEWQKCSITFEFTSEPVSDAIFAPSFGMQDDEYDGENIILEICGMKLELGDHATDWSPNKDDSSGGGSFPSGYYYYPVYINNLIPDKVILDDNGRYTFKDVKNLSDSGFLSSTNNPSVRSFLFEFDCYPDTWGITDIEDSNEVKAVLIDPKIIYFDDSNNKVYTNFIHVGTTGGLYYDGVVYISKHPDYNTRYRAAAYFNNFNGIDIDVTGKTNSYNHFYCSGFIMLLKQFKS